MPKIELTALDMHWIKPEDNGSDRCAHGRVQLAIDGHEFVKPDSDWTVSAAALFLLRTLARSHTKSQPVQVWNQLIPCCGHFLVSNVKPRKGYELESQGNSNGKDFDRALLTPHGQGLLDSEGADLDEVDISGCPYGPNPEVLHVNGAIRVVGEDGAEATVSFDAWKAAVFAFADQVKAFYDASPPRRSWDDPDDDAAYASFWSEWTRRRGA